MARQKTSTLTDRIVPPTETPPWLDKLRSPALISILLALITLVVFSPVFSSDFVNYDDPDYVTANSHVQSGLEWANVVWAFQTGHASNWHPLTWLSHMLDCQLFGEKATGPHLTNLFLHAANTVLLFLLLRRITGAHWRSALVAALFALHPLHVESVAWISERKDLLSAFFFFLTLLAYTRYAQGSKSPSPSPTLLFTKSPLVFYILSLFLYALGLMSKPMLVTLPFVLLLLDWWPLRRFSPSIRQSTNPLFHHSTTPFPRLLLEKIPFLALAAASCIVTFLVQRKGGAVSASISLGARISNALVSYVRYLGKTFWPFDLSVLYPHPGQWPAQSVIASTILLLALTATLIALARKPAANGRSSSPLPSDGSGVRGEGPGAGFGRPWFIVGWLWFLGTLIPVIGIIQVGIQSMADRYTYLPLIGIFIILAWSAGEVFDHFHPGAISLCNSCNPFNLCNISAAALLAACSLRTAHQVSYWRNSETLFRHATRVTRNNYLAYNNLGYFLSGKDKLDEAMENYRRALEINPNYEDALNNLGFALAGQKRQAEAIIQYDRALRIRPDHVEVHNNLGNALSETGKIDEAIEHYRFVLKHKPDHADAHNNLGIALAMQGKLDEAIPHFQAAVKYKQDYASAHSNLGNAFAAQHKMEDATREYQIALRLKPGDAQAHNNFGNVLAEQGKLPDAISHYEQALRLNTDNPEAHFNLGMALDRQGNRPEAIRHYQEALRLKPDYTDAARQLTNATHAANPALAP
jgi:tetratricopeptide (TPR) repeat protein